jgi:DNA repair exonuclease SbcCD ATPase subunit
MRISGLSLEGVAGWPRVELGGVKAGLNVAYGPPRSGKSAVVSFLSHTLFGKTPATLTVLGQRVAPPGEVTIEAEGKNYRVRRYHETGGPIRLTVAALDGTAADSATVPKLARGLSPALLAPLCSVSFREAPDVNRLLSSEYLQKWQAAFGLVRPATGFRVHELVARRDVLAQELETRIAGERQVSKDLESRSREIERTLHEAQRQAGEIERRLNAVEASLAETDARLRYRRLELNPQQPWQTIEPTETESEAIELDEQISHWRHVIGELAQREADVRARVGEIQSARVSSKSAAADQRAWLAVARQLAADLTGEVARLARASGSVQCVCHDAHPRLRPIAETLERQLNGLERLVESQQKTLEVVELGAEIDHLAGSQEELRRHVDHLLDRRQAQASVRSEEQTGVHASFSAADAAQLEARRAELEQERFELVERLRSQTGIVHDLQTQQSLVERQRASILSARSIEHVQRELAEVQHKLERAASGGFVADVTVPADDVLGVASDILAKLTSGDLIRLGLGEGGGVYAVSRTGETAGWESLSETHRDQLYLSTCLALVAEASRHGLWLPIVLDEPFEHLDARGTAAVAAVLDDFARQGHQVIVFTCERTAAERLASLGATAHDMLSARESTSGIRPGTGPTGDPAAVRKRSVKRHKNAEAKPRVRRTRSTDGETAATDKSDAA